jgi:hypothetical protein
MKTLTLCVTAALLLSGFAANSSEANSPDGLFAIQYSRSGVVLVDLKGQELLTLIRSTTGDTKFEVSWAPTSKHVVIVTNSALGSEIVAAWTSNNGLTWAKALEPDADLTKIANQAQRDAGSRLIAESFTLGDWISPDELQVKGRLKFSNHRQAEFTYGVQFGEGVIFAKDYKFTLSQN